MHDDTTIVARGRQQCAKLGVRPCHLPHGAFVAARMRSRKSLSNTAKLHSDARYDIRCVLVPMRLVASRRLTNHVPDLQRAHQRGIATFHTSASSDTDLDRLIAAACGKPLAVVVHLGIVL